MPRSEGRDDPSSAPPSITIEALFDYVGEGEYELSFSHGECFMVADASDEEWYEVCYGRNFGMVPKSYFAVVDDGAKTSASSKMSAASTRDGPMRSKASTAEDRVRTHMSKDLPHIPTSSSDPKTTTSTIKLAALYDFEAESVDELTVRAGEQLVLVAQDTSSEWYYARNPRWHGGDDVPEYGLVPVAFMEPKPQRDSNVLPTFATWQAMQREQADPSTAALAVAVAPHTETFQQSKQQQHERDHEHAREHTHDHEPPLLNSLLSLALPSLTTMLERTNDETLDVTPVHVYHVTVERHGGVQHVLHRTYDQFFALQKEMLRLFPKEAGQLDASQRILPYMPGPVPVATEQIAQRRRTDIDAYLRDLMRLPAYMIESYVVECFFRPHDTCSDPTVDELVVRAYADSEMELVRRFTNDVFGGGGSASGSTVQLPPKSTGAAHARLSGRSSRGGFATPSRRPSLDGGQAEQQRALSADFQRALSLQPPVAGAHGASVSTTSVPTTSHRSDFTIGQLVKIKVYQSVTSAPSYDGNGSAADTVHYYKVPVHVSLRSLTRKLREYLPQPFDALEYRDPRDGRRYAMTMDRELREAMQVCAGQPLVLFAV